MVLQLVRALKRRPGCHPVVGVIENEATPHRELAEACAAGGVDTIIIPCRRRLDRDTVMQLREMIRKENFCVLHTHGYKANILARAAAFGWEGALVATCHNWPGRSLRMRAYAVLDKLLLRGFDRVVAVSDEVKQKLPGTGFRGKRVRVIGNGIDVEPFARAYRGASQARSVRAENNNPVVGYVGRLCDAKGVGVLLESAALVRERFPGVRYLLVGDGPQREEYEARYGSPLVLFSGFRKGVQSCFGCMDVLALPSYAEGLPMVILEAMASRLPVVATSVGQVPDLVEEGSTGHLVKPGDTRGLAEAICNIITTPDLGTRMGAHGYAKVAAGYSAELMAERYLDVYQEALN